MKLEIKVIPKSGENRVRIEDNFVKIYLTTVPEKGKANKELVRMLAKIMRVPKSSIQITKGETSRVKTVEIAGVNSVQTMEKLKNAAK